MLFQYKILINKHFSMRILLGSLGVETAYSTVYCPFHNDKGGGHKSAKFYQDDNSLYCWSCCKTYRPFEALGLLGCSEADMVAELKVRGLNNIPLTWEPNKDFTIFRDGRIIKELTKAFKMGGTSLDDYINALCEHFTEVEQA